MKKILDLDSYRNFDLDECIQDKIDTRVVDNAGLPSPISVSLIIPVRFETVRSDEEWGLEEHTFNRILREVSQLVDLGYLDELIVIDGTVGPDRRPDFRVLQQVVRIAYEEIGLFHDQVEMLHRYRVQGEMARRGYADLFVKVIHQFDRNLQKVLLRYGVSGVIGTFGVPRGKGAALWISVPIASGDVVVFVDADIINFQKEFVVALSHPIVYSWHVEEPTVKFVKAYYDRVTVVGKGGEERTEGIYGGRVCRILARPLLELLSRHGLYPGIDAFKYPLAGEFAIARGVAKRLQFTNDYTIEMAMLTQLYRMVGPETMAQVFLDVFYHIGQPYSSLSKMVRQIAGYVVRELGQLGLDAETVLREYREAAEERIRQDAQVAKRLAERVEYVKVNHSEEDDRSRLADYLAILRELLTGEEPPPATQMFPSWNDIDRLTGNYVQISRMLRRRAVQSTWARLYEAGYVQ